MCGEARETYLECRVCGLKVKALVLENCGPGSTGYTLGFKFNDSQSRVENLGFMLQGLKSKHK